LRNKGVDHVRSRSVMNATRSSRIDPVFGIASGSDRKALEARIGRSIEAGELRAVTNPGRLVDLLMGTITLPLLFFLEPPAVDEAAAIVDQVLSGFGVRERASEGS
jgi:hypothetical protein